MSPDSVPSEVFEPVTTIRSDADVHEGRIQIADQRAQLVGNADPCDHFLRLERECREASCSPLPWVSIAFTDSFQAVSMILRADVMTGPFRRFRLE